MDFHSYEWNFIRLSGCGPSVQRISRSTDTSRFA